MREDPGIALRDFGVQVIPQVACSRGLPEWIEEIGCRGVLNPARAVPILDGPTKARATLASGFESVTASRRAGEATHGFFIRFEIFMPAVQDREVGVPDPLNHD